MSFLVNSDSFFELFKKLLTIKDEKISIFSHKSSLFVKNLSTKWVIVVKCGKKMHTFAINDFNYFDLTNFIGTYECKIDAKGRVLVPGSLKKQLPSLESGFVLKRSVFDKCIELWPKAEWDVMMSEMNKLNRFDVKANEFIRRFMAGVKMVDIDDAGRLLISKDLIDFAGITKDLVLTSKINIVEIWDKELYEKSISLDDMDFASLAQEVMGNLKGNENGVS